MGNQYGSTRPKERYAGGHICAGWLRLPDFHLMIESMSSLILRGLARNGIDFVRPTMLDEACQPSLQVWTNSYIC